MKRTQTSVVTSLVTILSAHALMAQQSAELVTESFVTTNGRVSFTETYNEDFDRVDYYVNVLSGVPVFGAAFSYQQEVSGVDNSFGTFFEGSEDSWGAQVITEDSWDAGEFFTVNGFLFQTSSFGTFDSLFGTVDDIAVLYSNTGEYNPLTEENDVDGLATIGEEPGTFSRYGGLPATTGVFFDDKGNIVGSSPIPEPSGLLLISLAGLSLALRRRRA